MLVLVNKEGRLGHQLSQLATIAAYAGCYKKTYHYAGFYEKFGDCWKDEYYVKHATVKLNFYMIILRLLKLLRIGSCRLRGAYFLLTTSKNNELAFEDVLQKLFRQPDRYVFTDYVFNDVIMLTNQRMLLQHLWCPDSILQNNVAGKMRKWRSKYSVLVGVHIRRDDFRYFAEGKFFYQDDTYVSLMHQFVKNSKAESNKILFVLCSDEPVDMLNYTAFNCYHNPASAVEDFLILQQVDYIIASRSIFSTMANFMGNNKIYQIRGKDENISLADFKNATELLLSTFDFKGKTVTL